MSAAKSLLLADSLASSLSENARAHLRAARVARHPELSASREGLRALLLERGFAGLAVSEPLLDLEARAGGAGFPRSRVLGAACFLRACPALAVKELPLFEGVPAFPVFGDPEHLEEWESPFCVMGASGAMGVYDAPYGPAPAFDSLEHFLEIEALAPLEGAVHVVRVDALCGEMLAGLVGALAHAPATGAHAAGWVGEGGDVWVKELRTGIHGEGGWSRWHGTFLVTEQVDLVVDVMGLMLEQGFSLGYAPPLHRGPPGVAPAGAAAVLSFVDKHPELGHRAEVEVTVWGGPGNYTFTRRELRVS